MIAFVVVAGALLLVGPVRPRSAAAQAPPPGPTDRIRRAAIGRVPSVALVPDAAIAGWAAVAFCAALIAPPLLLIAPIGVVADGVRRARREQVVRRRRLVRGLPETIDQLALAVGAGLTLPEALRTSAPFLPDGYDRLVDDLIRRLDDGAAMVDALETFGAAVPAEARRPVAVLAAATRDGTPVGPSLRRAAEEARRVRRREAETRARRLPVLLLLPLATCVLPAFVLLTLVPLLVGSLGDLTFPGS